MRRLMRTTLVPAGLLLLALGACASTREPDNRWTPLLHADVPLWHNDDWDKIWPKHWVSEKTFGCGSEIATGEWIETETPADELDFVDDPGKRRIDLVGAMHCYFVFSDEGPFGGTDIGHVVDLGLDHASGHQLLALQRGTVPGSTYELVAVDPDKRPITRMLLLDVDCWFGQMRGGHAVDISRTDYCSVPNQKALIATARKAALRSPAAVLQHLPKGRSEDSQGDDRPLDPASRSTPPASP